MRICYGCNNGECCADQQDRPKIKHKRDSGYREHKGNDPHVLAIAGEFANERWIIRRQLIGEHI
jgi:hypothetical protein